MIFLAGRDFITRLEATFQQCPGQQYSASKMGFFMRCWHCHYDVKLPLLFHVLITPDTTAFKRNGVIQNEAISFCFLYATVKKTGFNRAYDISASDISLGD